jgi:hypothetical protein
MAEQLPLPDIGGDLLSVSQVARILERSPDRVRQYVAIYERNPKKGLKSLRFGPKRERFFAPADVAEFRKVMDSKAALREAAEDWSMRLTIAAMRS